MGLFSSIVSGISSAISSLCSACSSFLKPVLDIALKITGQILKGVTNLLLDICKAFGVEVGEEDVEDGKLGVMIEDTRDTVKPENYNSTAEYIRDVKAKANMQAVNEKMKTLTTEQKEANKLVSVAVLNKIASEELGVEPDLKFYVRAYEMDLDSQETMKLIEGLKEHGIDNLAAVCSYLDGDLDFEKMEQVDAALKEGLSKIDPELTTEEQKENALSQRLQKMEERMKEEN